MTNTVISVEHLSKTYRLGQIGTGTFSRDLELWWAKIRGKPNPFLKLGQTDHGNHDGEEIWALKDINFTVEQGEVLGIIGKNGAGKSTLLKILSRVTAPTEGNVKVKGRIASLLEVGTGFHPELTGRENIYLNGAILGMTRQEVTRKFDEIVDFAEVEKFIDTPVKRYSSGMYVRLAFAVAAHLDPEILVVDEVLAVGDFDFQNKCLGKMKDVGRSGRTILFVSHNLTFIENLCDKAFLIEQGKLIRQGNTAEIIESYASKQDAVSIYESPIINFDSDYSKVTQIRLLSFEETVCDHFYINSPMIIDTIIWAPKDISNIQYGFDLFTSSGIQLAVATTWIKNFKLDLKKGENRVRFFIEKLRFTPGIYSVSFGLYKLPGEHHDYQPNCLSFTILDDDIWKTGHLPTGRSQGLTWLDYTIVIG